MDTAIVTTRLIGQDAMSNFTMASAEALKKLGKVTIYTFAYERPPLEGVEVRLLGGKNAHSVSTNLAALAGTFRIARELSLYDLLLIVNPDVGSMPAYHLACRYNPRLKVMWTFHGLTPVQYVSGFRDRMLMRMRRSACVWSMKRSDRIQVFSEYIKKEIGEWGIDTSKIIVMPFGIDLSRMSAGDGRKVREKYGINNKFLILYVGRLVKFKHVDELIKAVAIVPDVCLIVVGGGPEHDRLEALPQELRVSDRVKLAGRVSDEELPDYYAACDAWATASRHEGFCVPIVEAMAAGKPVVVPGSGAIPETMGNAGILYETGNPKSLAEAIKSLSSNAMVYDDISRKARAQASKYDIDGVINNYIEFISLQVVRP